MSKLCIITIVGYTLSTLAADRIHFGSTGNPLNGLTITWHSTTAGDSIRWGYSASYEKGKFAGERRNDDFSGYLYDYHFPALKPDSMLYYSIKGSSWEPARTFATSCDTLSRNFSFIGGGDSRTNMTPWKRIADSMATIDVDFHLVMGDLVAVGGDSTAWKDWYTYGSNFLQKHLFYNTIGNHEAGNSGSYIGTTVYANQLVMPSNELYYSFDFGNARIVCLNSQNPGDTLQYSWLKNILNVNKTWEIVFFHKPFFTGSASHETDMNSYRTTWWKAFDDNNVDIVLGGHTHYYCRAKPINLNANPNSFVVDSYGVTAGKGRLQVVAGSYGAPLYPDTGMRAYVAKAASVYHYCRFTVNDSILHMDAIDIDGKLIDSLTLDKRAIPTAIARGGLHQRNAGFQCRFDAQSSTIHVYGIDETSVSRKIGIYALDGTRYTGLVRRNTDAILDVARLPLGVYVISIPGYAHKKVLIAR